MDRCVAEGPNRPLVKSGRTTLSYGRTQDQAYALAAALHNLGVGAGDRIAIDLPNGTEFVVSVLAAANLGATVVPLNPAYSAHELQFMLRNSEASVVIAAEEYDGHDNLELFERMQFALPELQYLVTVGEEDLWYDDRIFQFEDLVSSGEGRDFARPAIDAAEEVFAILYTAGTTGKPKGVMLTHANLVEANARVAEAIGMTRADTALVTIPMFNIFGLGALISAVSVGASVAVLDRFDAAGSLELAEAVGATVVHGAPTMYAMQLRSEVLEGLDLSRLRAGVVAGAPALDTLVQEIRDRFVPSVEIAYGMTETSAVVSITRPEDAVDKRNFTVGRALDGVEVRVLGDDGSVLPVESIGELAVRGFNVMKGYYRQPDETNRSFTEDGFFRTGDIGMVDEDGYLHVVGRKRDTINRGGYMIYPRELEDLLRLHPAVQEAAVVGVEDEVQGELTCACVLPVEGAIVTGDEVKDFCRGRIAQYKVPDLVRFVDTFPMTGSGKIRRVELARMVRAEQAARRA
ncbi:MAG: class I adenylate-forming enzyme family protein [Gemmatimonadales bacterium]|jgi:fatty-acyl-CoA synthase